MAYRFYLGNLLLPVAPQKLQLKIAGQNKTLTLINEGEVNVLKSAKLTDVSFDALLPNVRHPFAVYAGEFKRAAYYLETLERLKQDRQPFQFIVTRSLPSGRRLFDTNLRCSLEEYTLKEDAKTGFDVVATVKLKQYKSFGTKTCTIIEDGSGARVVVDTPRESSRITGRARAYTVPRNGQTLWEVARLMYGDATMYGRLYAANADVLREPNNLQKGTVLLVPAAM